MSAMDTSAGPAFCSACAQPLKPGARFCANCGAAVIRAAATVPAPASPAAQPAGAAPPTKKPKKNRHWGLALTFETLFCGGFAVFGAATGIPLLVAIFGTLAGIFLFALICVLLVRAIRSGEPSLLPSPGPATTTPSGPGAPHQYSPDGRWWWNGAQWVNATSTGPAPVPAQLEQSGPPTKRKSGWGSKVAVLLIALVAVGILWLFVMWYYACS
jgi:hypothetical protein